MVAPLLPLQLTDTYVCKGETTLIGPINLTLEGAGTTCIMGPNGAGKTTLLRVMHGLQKLSSGKIEWAVATHIARHRQAFVFQAPTMMRRSVIENIIYPLKLRGVDKAEAFKSAEHWAHRTGLNERAHHKASSLSGGERQKLALARALITAPDIVFLDEPTANLDGRSTGAIEAILKEAVANGTRMVLATHNIGQAKRLADEIVFLNNGKIASFLKAPQFFHDPGAESARKYLKGDLVE